ncbi:MAG: hypothetical protein ACLFTS_00845 [Candidatus Paceibacterota bacterium]
MTFEKKDLSSCTKAKRFIVDHSGFISLILLITALTIVVNFLPIKNITELISPKTAYLVLFLTALLGISGLSSAPFYATLVILSVVEGYNPFLMIIIASPARTFGDLVLFYLGEKGHLALSEVTEEKIKRFSIWLNKKPLWLILFITYTYTSVAPLPKDILMTILGLGRVKLRLIILAVFFGNATFIALIYLVSTNTLSF